MVLLWAFVLLHPKWDQCVTDGRNSLVSWSELVPDEAE